MSTTRRVARKSVFVFIAALGVASVSCGGGGGDAGTGPGGGGGATVTHIDLNPTSATVFVGKTSTLTATPKDVDGAAVTGKTITWSSSDASIASVAGGVVTGAKPGNVTITAAVGTVNSTANVTVLAPVATVELTPSPASVVVGGTAQLTATLKDASGNVLTDRTITWTSDNDVVASVTTAGLVTGKSLGTANVTATVEGKLATVKVTVTPVPVSSVSVTPATSTLAIGGTVQLSATTKDAAGNTLTGRAVSWTTSDANVATVVSTTGEVTAKAAGTATITATSEGKTATAQITVTTASVASVAVSPSNVSVLPGATTQLSAVTSDASGHVLTGRTVTWSSSDKSKATVDANGLVTGVAFGQVTITATSEGKAGTATVKVSDGVAPTLVSLNVSPSPVDVTSSDKTVTFTARITDAGSGVSQFAVTASAPDGPFASCVDTALDSGTTADGTWSCSVTIPVGADPGDWKLLVLVSDAGYSSRTYSTAELAAIPAQSTFNVQSNWDMIPPVFKSLTVPSSVSVASGAQTVTVSAALTDNRSGTASFDFIATSPGGHQVGCTATTPASGTILDGTWTCSFSMPADAEAGSWKITVRATDRAFRYQTYGPQPDGSNIAFPSGFPTTITVTR